MMSFKIDRRWVLTTLSALGIFAGRATAQTGNRLGAPPPLEVFGRLPAISRIDLSPSGERVAMVMRQGDQRILLDFNIIDGSSHSLSLGDMVIHNLFWADDKRIVVTTRDVLNVGQKVDVVRGIVVDVPAKNSFPLSGQTSEYDPFVYGLNVYEHKGKKALQVQRYSRTLGYTIDRLDLDTGKSTALMTDVPVDRYYSDRKGNPLFGYEYKWEQKEWRLKFYRGGGWKTVYEEKGRLGTPDLVGIGRDGKSAIVYFGSGEKKGNYYEIKPEGLFSEPLNAEVPSFGLMQHPRTGQLTGFVNVVGDTISYDVFDPEIRAVTDKVSQAFAGQHYSISSMSEDPRKVIVYTESEFDAGSFTYIDFVTGKVMRVGQTRPDLPPEWLSVKKPFRFKAQDGLELNAYLTLPPGRPAKNLPLIVVPHGGPQARDDLGFEYDVQAFASRGYAVLQVNFRGSDGYGLAFVEKGYGEWGLKMQSDLSDGVKHLATKGTIDPARVAICGSSYGGYAALAGATYEPDTYRCAVSVSGISDLKTFLKQEVRSSGSEYGETVLYWKRFLGDEATLDQRSPAQNTTRIKVPLLLIHGKNDTVVDPLQSLGMQKAMMAAGKPVTYVELSGEDHYMSKEETRLQMLTSAIGFIEAHNPAY